MCIRAETTRDMRSCSVADAIRDHYPGSTPLPAATNTPSPTYTPTPLASTTATPLPSATATAVSAPTATATPSPEPGDTTLCSQTSANVLLNPSFEDGARNWTFYSSGLGGISTPGGDAYECAAAARLSFVTVANNMQLYQKGFALRAGQRYRLSFAAYATNGRDLQVRLQKHLTPFTSYGLAQSVNLSSGWQEFAYEFVATGFSGTTTDTRLYFWFVGNAQAGDVYWIDRVRLEAQ